MKEKKKDEDRQSGFRVTDKRHFTREGEVVEGAEEHAAPTAREASGSPSPEEPQAPPPEEPPAEGPSREEPGGTAPPGGGAEKVDFSHLVMSLAGTAYHALGMPDPVTKQKGEVDLQAASQMIDLLAVLDEKTKGNLSPQEGQILTGILTELRSLFIQAKGFGR